ncbi:unnamed protein product [Closterium sp. NIES-53]
MASLRVLPFDSEGRHVAFDTWHDDLQLYPLSDSRDSVSLFDHVSGAAPAPPATADLSAFATVADLVTHLRTSDARYCATIPAEFLPTNQPPMFITLYFIVTRLPDSLHSVRDHFLTLDPTSLTVDLLEQHLLAAETSAVATSLFLRTSVLLRLVRSAATARARVAGVVEEAAVVVEVAVGVVVGAAVEEAEVVEVVVAVGPVAEVEALVAAVEAAEGVAAVEVVGPVVVGLDLSVDALVAVGASSSSVRVRLRRLSSSRRCFARLDDAWRTEFGDDVKRPRWAQLLRSGVAIFDLDFDVIISAMYALSFSAEGDCYWCVPPDPGIAAAALGASASGTPPGTAPAEALHTFTLDSGASRCFFRDSTNLTPLPAPVPVTLADPFGGPVVASPSTVLPCPAVPSGSLSGLHLPSFSTNLVSTAALQDAMVTTTIPGGQRVSICTCTRTGRHLATSGSHLLLVSPPVAPDSSLAPPPGSPLPATPSWHALPSPCLWSPQVSASPAALACPALSSLRRGTAARSSSLPSSFPPTNAPLQTLHMDVWGPARVSGQGCERYFLLVVDDYTRYTTVFPLRSKGEVSAVLIPWIRTVRLQLRERFGQDLPVLRLHSDRGGEFSSDLLRDFCRGEGITQSFTLPDSPQQNGIAERRIGLVMEVARTSMIHAAAPHFLWPFAVQYAAYQLKLWPRVSLPETSPTLRWTGKVGDASVFQFYHPTSRRVLPSQDVTFDKSVPFYRFFPYRSAPSPPPPLFLAPCPPPVDPLPPQGPAPSGVSQVDPLPGTALVQVAVVSGAAPGAASGGAVSGGAEPGVAGSEGAGSGGAEPEGVEPGGAESEGAEPEGAESEGAESGGAEPRGAAWSEGPAGASPRLPSQQLREWLVKCAHRWSGALGAGEPGGARAGGTAVTTGVGDPTEPGAAGTGGAGAGVVGPASPLPVPSPYTKQSGGLTERREPASHPVSPVRTARRAPRSRPPPVPGTHTMALRPSSVPLRVPLHAPPKSSLSAVPDPESDRACAASPTVARLLATAVTDPSFESAAASALVAELLDFAAACRLDYASALVAKSVPASPPSVGGECALGTDVLEDSQEEFECLAAAVPRFASLLLAPEGDPDAPDIPTLRSYAEAITGTYSSHWQAAMDAEMASWKSTGTYVDEVLPHGVNIVDGMRIFRGVDYFQTFSPTPKMTTLRVLLHVATQHDYELHSLDFSTAFLQGSLHEEIWLCRPPGFTGSFPTGTQWSLRRPVYGLRLAPREWHDTLKTTLAALGFVPSTADLSLFLRTDTSLPPFYVLVYVDDLVFATADTEALTLVKSELQKRHTCTDLGPSALRLPVLLATAHSSVYRPLALSSTFGRVRRAEWSVPRACGLPHVPDDLHST